ncbi:hypothetical protein PR202_ga25182 [Eleusine coracana subsp. coracana]|uniref:Glycosyltransferase n=1 Tax=Eleusine coracana subsp. coracana TaxID=191504 RepID=A0AAV5DAZ4_ELECO|nr:hypothetical protein PR202_ga25182 [Eleusine coracana subsp. coracana]
MANPTVVLIPFCVPGHLTSMLNAGKRLLSNSSSSHALSFTVLITQITWVPNHMSEVADLIRREEAESGFEIRFHHLPAVELPVWLGAEDFISRFIQLHAPHVKAAISGLPSPVAAVVVDFFCTTLLDVTRELALPAYVYFTSSASMLALMLRLPALDAEVACDLVEVDGAVDVPGMPPVPAALVPTPLLKKDVNYTWFVYHGNRFMEAAGIIINTVAELESAVLAAVAEDRCVPGRRAPTVYPIGPVLSFKPPGEQRHECVTWLDAQPKDSVVLLCFGSMGGSFPEPQVREIAEGLERSGHRFLWVLRGPPHAPSPYPTDANVDELLPEGFLERTKDRGLVWPKWAPQKEILAHAAVGGFVTHCGWNSVLEALWHGVPMAPWPLYAEQHLNAFLLVAYLGVAVAMEVDRKRDNFVEAAELERAVRSLMGGDSVEGRKTREKAMEAKALCRNAVVESGSSYASLQKLTQEISRMLCVRMTGSA